MPDAEPALRPPAAFVRLTPGPGVALAVAVQAGVPVVLRTGWLGRAHLGAVVDAAGGVLSWVEVWVQVAEGDGAPAVVAALTNAERDVRWARWLASVAPESVVATGWERTPAPPWWVDPAGGRVVVPVDAGTGEALARIEDDNALLAAGREAYSTGSEVFLGVSGRPGVVAPLPEAGGGGVAAHLPGGGAGLVPLNPQGGRVAAVRLAPLEWDDYVALLGGQPWRGLVAGRPAVKLGGPYAALDDWDRLQQEGGHLFGRGGGRAGRFHETFHLKLLLLRSLVAALHARVAATQLPQLNVSPAALRVDLATEAGSLPRLWTARVVIAEASGAVACAAPGDLRYFVPVEPSGPAVFRPASAGEPVRGSGELRVRKVHEAGGRVQVEATVVAPGLAKASPRDLVSTRFPMPGAGVVELVGTIDSGEALSHGEARFRTGTLEPSAAVRVALKAAEGAIYPGTPYQTRPLFSAPYDLHAVGVLAVQVLLTGTGKPLGVAVDEVLSLARTAGSSSGTGGPVDDRFRAAAAADARWPTALGPQNHGHGAADAAEGFALLPAELWWSAVAWAARCFPGESPDAFCRDLADAPPHRLEAALEPARQAIEALVLRSRSLLLVDWPANREIARVIQRVR